MLLALLNICSVCSIVFGLTARITTYIELVCFAVVILYKSCSNLFIYTMMYGCMVYYEDAKCTAINLTVRLRGWQPDQCSAVVWLSELTSNN